MWAVRWAVGVTSRPTAPSPHPAPLPEVRRMADPSTVPTVPSAQKYRRKRKRRGFRPTLLDGPSSSTSTIHDLNVPLPRTQGALTDLMSRLQSTGYGAVAFSHTAYGRPDPKRDAASVVLQDSVLESSLVAGGGNKKKPKLQPLQMGLQILKRFNAVVEELSDIAYYTDRTVGGSGGEGSGSKVHDVLDSYDIVALSPRSDATFASACSTASRADVIMLDYSTGRLPFKLKSSSIRAAAKLGIAFELCYALAILDPSKRKALVRIALDLHNASRGVRNPSPRIILTSGSRVAAGEDFGTLALRAPLDLVNVLKSVLKFGDVQAMGAMGAASSDVVTRFRNRKLGLCVIPSGGENNGMKNTVGVDTEVGGSGKESSPTLGTARDRVQKLISSAAFTKEDKAKEGNGPVTKKWTPHRQESESGADDSEEGEDDDDDGFITFS